MDSQRLEMRKETPISQGELLKQWRQVIGLSQQDIARLGGVSQAHVSSVEKGLAEIGGNLKSFLEGVARRRATHFPVH